MPKYEEVCIEATFVKAGDMEELQAAVRPETRLFVQRVADQSPSTRPRFKQACFFRQRKQVEAVD